VISLTIPNQVTILGFLFIFLYISSFLFGDSGWLSFLFLFCAGFTDALDGFLARQLKQESFLGSILDPLRDRVILAAILWNFCLINPKTWPIIEVIIVAEILFFTSWFFDFSLVNERKFKWQHIFGKTRQLGHLVFGGLGVLRILPVDIAVICMAACSLFLLAVRILRLLIYSIFVTE